MVAGLNHVAVTEDESFDNKFVFNYSSNKITFFLSLSNFFVQLLQLLKMLKIPGFPLFLGHFLYSNLIFFQYFNFLLNLLSFIMFPSKDL